MDMTHAYIGQSTLCSTGDIGVKAIAPRAVEIWLNFDLALDFIDIWGPMTGVSGFAVYKSQWKIAMIHCLKKEL